MITSPVASDSDIQEFLGVGSEERVILGGGGYLRGTDLRGGEGDLRLLLVTNDCSLLMYVVHY